MNTKEFFKLSTLEMQIEVLETEAYKYANKAHNEFTLRGNSNTHDMYDRKCRSLLKKIKNLKNQ